MGYVLVVQDLYKKYKTLKVLNGINMKIPEGSIYGFVGRNGSGKTTLIRMISGLQKADSGSYTLYGIENGDSRITKSRRRMGAVVETPSIYLEMTAEENLRQQYDILGLPSYKGIQDILQLVELDNTGRKKAKNFSLGMKQRLGIAIALSGDPDFLVLDEPINGLDPQGIIELRELILRLNRERGITVLISSHILDELSKLATHFGFIDSGRIVKEMSAKELEMVTKKSLRVLVTDTMILSQLLDKMNYEYKVISSTQADIYSPIHITELVIELKKYGCDVLTVKEVDESLESYYMSLVGGVGHE